MTFNPFTKSEEHFSLKKQTKKPPVLPPLAWKNLSAHLPSTMFLLLHRLHKLIWTKESWLTSSPISVTLTSSHLSPHLWMPKDGKLPTVVADWELSSGSKNFCWFCTWEPTGTPERTQIELWRMAVGSNAWPFITWVPEGIPLTFGFRTYQEDR